MPNWVYSDFIVAGPRKSVSQFVQDVDWDTGIFESILPLPPEAYSKIGEGDLMLQGYASVLNGGVDGVQIAVDTWGNKWGDCSTEFEGVTILSEELSYLYCKFETPWSPPTAGICNIAKKYPSLYILWSGIEEQPSFAGYILAHGDTYVDWSYDIDNNLPAHHPSFLDEEEEDMDTAWDEWHDSGDHELWYADIKQTCYYQGIRLLADNLKVNYHYLDDTHF